jgi:murein DD-endopeptidase MepM/ murein hydrolase activator NlpD
VLVVWEIQYHPASIRGTVRFFFLSKRKLRWLAVSLAAALLLMAAGIALAPRGVRAVALYLDLAVAKHEARVARAELLRHLQTLAELDQRVAEARKQQERLALVLGVGQGDSGLGGYTTQVPERFVDPMAAAAMTRAARLDTACRALEALGTELTAFAARHAELVHTVPSISPLPPDRFVLSSPFGERISPFTGAPDFHTGIDLAASEGTPVLATANGTVEFAGRVPLKTSVHWWRYGNLVILSHGDRYLTLYSHLLSIGVRRGEAVHRGQLLGTVGNTGWSTSPHLHYEVRSREHESGEFVPVDPRIFVLNYRWSDVEMALAASRRAPVPPSEPIPTALEVR